MYKPLVEGSKARGFCVSKRTLRAGVIKGDRDEKVAL